VAGERAHVELCPLKQLDEKLDEVLRRIGSEAA
jgi:hypothetical protein